MPSPTSTIVKAEQSPKTTLIALITNVTAMATALVPLVAHYDRVIKIIGPTFGGMIVALGALSIAATCVAAAGASILKLFPRRDAEHDGGAVPSSNAGDLAGEESSMTTEATHGTPSMLAKFGAVFLGMIVTEATAYESEILVLVDTELKAGDVSLDAAITTAFKAKVPIVGTEFAGLITTAVDGLEKTGEGYLKTAFDAVIARAKTEITTLEA